jgi:hypothetical protein
MIINVYHTFPNQPDVVPHTRFNNQKSEVNHFDVLEKGDFP